MSWIRLRRSWPMGGRRFMVQPPVAPAREWLAPFTPTLLMHATGQLFTARNPLKSLHRRETGSETCRVSPQDFRGKDAHACKSCRKALPASGKTLLFPQQARERLPVDAQRLGGAGLVAALLPQDALGVAAGELFQRGAIGEQRIGQRGRGWRRPGRRGRRSRVRLDAPLGEI